MPHIATLPSGLEDVEMLMARQKAAEKRKEHWRSLYQECYRYAMPQRETFSFNFEGQTKETRLYDSTLQETTYTAANTLCALLFPGWTRWAQLSFGPEVDPEKITEKLETQLRDATDVFFGYLNHSNFPQVINETALDLMVGTGALCFDEGDDYNPFRFEAVPLAALELEEGPNGTIETKFIPRRPTARNLPRIYEGLYAFDLPERIARLIVEKPDEIVDIVQGEIYDPSTKKYYGVVLSPTDKSILWRYDYGTTCPMIVARATKVSGELYGRGRVMLALSDARTLDRMQEFVLRHSALQVAPPMTGVSDGVLNPHTAVLRPNVVLPVASNDTGNPSIRVLDVGGNFAITENIMTDLRARVRRTMLGPEPTEGPVRSATEVNVNDRNRLWAMNGELGRIQAELLTKIIARGVDILQRRGLIPKFKVDGKYVVVKYTSPFARSQEVEDALAVTNALGAAALLGPEMTMLGLKVEEIPGYLARKYGVPETLIRDDTEREEKIAELKGLAEQAVAAQQGAAPGAGPQMAGQLG